MAAIILDSLPFETGAVGDGAVSGLVRSSVVVQVVTYPRFHRYSQATLEILEVCAEHHFIAWNLQKQPPSYQDLFGAKLRQPNNRQTIVYFGQYIGITSIASIS